MVSHYFINNMLLYMFTNVTMSSGWFVQRWQEERALIKNIHANIIQFSKHDGFLFCERLMIWQGQGDGRVV